MKPIHILHVEDNEGDIMLIRDSILDSGIAHTLDIVRDGYEALQFLRKEDPYQHKGTPDLLLLDINMPNMNGHELLDNIKSDEKLRHLPVIMLTTSSSKSDILKSYQKYSNCFLTKPNSADELDKMIQEVGKFWSTVAQLPSAR